MATPDEIKIRIIAKDEASRVFQRTQASAEGLKRSFTALKVALAAGGVATGLFVKSAIQTASQVQNLQVRLKYLTGSTKDGARAFQIMSGYASQVPFALEEIQQGSAPLLTVANNVEELNGLLSITGDLAVVSGLSFQETAGQVQRAMTAGIASADLFRERGIAAFLGFQSGVSYSAEETRKKIVEAFRDGTTTAAGATKDLANTFTGQVSMMQDAWFQLKLSFADSGMLDTATTSVQKLTELLKDPQVIQGVQLFSNSLLDLFEFVTRNAKTLMIVGSTWLGFKAGKDVAGGIGGVIGALTAGTGAFALLNDEMLEMGDVGKRTVQPLDAVANVMDKVSVKTKNASNAADELAKKYKFVEMTMMDVEHKGIRTIEDGFVDLISGTKSVSEAFRDMARSILRDMIRLQLRNTLTQALYKGMMGIGSGSFDIGPGQPLRTDTFKGSTQQSFAAPKHYPEIQGQVITNQTSNRREAPVNINISTGVSQTVRAELTNMLPQITQAAQSVVADARMRGGSFSNAMGS